MGWCIYLKMKRIILHGHLRKLYPHDVVVEASTVAEAMRSLSHIPELQPASGQPHPVFIKGVNSDVALYSVTDMEEIHVYPRRGGSGGRGGLMQIIIGIAIIALAIALGPGFVMWGITSGQILVAGAMMVLGGLLQFLVPVPGEPEAEQTSKYLGATQNTVKIGTRIGLLYGFGRIGGHFLSFDVDAVNWEGDSSGTGAATLIGDSVFVEHDKIPVAVGPVNPVFAGPVASPTNIPTSGWIRA